MNKDIYSIERNELNQILWTEEQIKIIISLYKSGLYLKEIWDRFNVGYHNISKLLKTKNIETKGFRNKYPVNESFFHDINSPIKAYWLGVLYADGSLTGKNEIRLGMKDKEHVEKYKKAIGAINHKIGKTIDKRWKKECYDFYLGIKSSTMFEDLCQWGCVPNKTYKLRDIPQISQDLLPHFIRGYFDGDGSIHKVGSQWRISFVGTKEFLENLKKVLKISVKVNQEFTYSENGERKEKDSYYIQVMGKYQLKRILDWIYNGATQEICLDRKYSLYLEFLSEMGASLSNL